jgi:hypothetical protein
MPCLQVRVKGLSHVCFTPVIVEEEDEDIDPEITSNQQIQPLKPKHGQGNTAFIMSSPFDMSPREFGSLLSWHMAWHSKVSEPSGLAVITTHLNIILDCMRSLVLPCT